MLQNLIITFTIVFPFMAYLAIGIGLKRFNVVDDDFTGKLNKFINRVTLPVNIFNSLYSKDLSAMAKSPATPYVLTGTVLVILFLMWFIKRIEPDYAKQGALVHTGYRGNAMLFALPIAQGIFGDDVAEITIVLAVVVLINNATGVPIMEHYRKLSKIQKGEATKEGSKFSLSKTLMGWLKTPLFDGVILGVLWSLFRIPMPAVCGKVVSALAATVVPLAFIVLGARMDLEHLKANSRNVMTVVFMRLVIFPAIFLIYPIAAGWNERLIVAVLVAFGCPSAVVSYSMTEAFECDGEMAGEFVSLTSFFAMFSLFIWIFCFKQFGLLA
ncbi:MAG: AEC family transporter [Firmicutes bacterium]|nr:AEC family transporter [Bacillota bacterium]